METKLSEVYVTSNCFGFSRKCKVMSIPQIDMTCEKFDVITESTDGELVHTLTDYTPNCLRASVLNPGMLSRFTRESKVVMSRVPANV